MRSRGLLPWLAAGGAGLALLVWASPRLFPLVPELALSRAQARIISLELLRDLGPMPGDVYIVTDLQSDASLERRLQHLATSHGLPAVAASPPASWVTGWRVSVFEPGAGVGQWLYLANLGVDGQVLSLRRRLGDPESSEAEGELDEDTAQRRARNHLRAFGLDGGLAEPAEIRRIEPADSTGALTYVRWRHASAPLEGLSHGQEVLFEGSELRGHSIWYDDERGQELRDDRAQLQLASMVQMLGLYLMLPLAVVWFLRLYHEGVLGISRGVRVAAACVAASVVWLWLSADAVSTGTTLGPVSRQTTTWLTAGFIFLFYFFALGVLASTSWSVGEALCRRRWPEKLAAVDAVLRLRWDNATVARSAVLSWSGGLAMAGGIAGLSVLGQRFGVWPSSSFMHSTGFDSNWPGVSLILGTAAVVLPLLLFLGLLVPSWAFSRPGSLGGSLIAWGAFALLPPLLICLPLVATWGQWMMVTWIPVVLFRQSDAAASIGAPFVATVLVPAGQLAGAASPSLQLNGWLAIAAIAAPLVASLRHLGSGEEFTYAYDDVPVHVRRIAERERHRLELDTAREIQAAILPPPPAVIDGIEIAHVYLPATEVGGDFFDVRSLADGRLIAAVGDVAGHGMSSGLVMSMMKAALRVQSKHAPEVAEVLAQLNGQVRSGAGRRLLTTLCYCLLDPREGRVVFACAGHPFPYRVSASGRLEELRSVAYPLGVRETLDLQVRHAHLEPGDSLFLYSDGLVEARAEGSEQPFGFERLEAALESSAGHSPALLRDGVLSALRAHTGGAPQDDDLTLLVLRRPLSDEQAAT